MPLTTCVRSSPENPNEKKRNEKTEPTYNQLRVLFYIRKLSSKAKRFRAIRTLHSQSVPTTLQSGSAALRERAVTKMPR